MPFNSFFSSIECIEFIIKFWKTLEICDLSIFNKLDLVNTNSINEKLKEFKNKVKKSYEITSLISNQNFEKIKKIIYKKCI